MKAGSTGAAVLAALWLAACSDDEEPVDHLAVGGAGGQSQSSGGTSGTSAGTAGSGARGGLDAGGGAGGSVGSGGSSAAGRGGADGASGSSGSAGSGGSAGSATDGGVAFPDDLYRGVWLVGWSGDLDHFSWVRFLPTNQPGTNGTWAVIDSNCVACTPYIHCEGTDGLFSTGPAAGALWEISMQFPTACTNPPRSQVWTIERAAPATYPSGADLELSISTMPDQQVAFTAVRYPESACSPDFTSCAF